MSESAGSDLSLVLPHLGAGGAQKVAVLAAEHFQQAGYRVELITLLPDQEVLHVLPLGVDHIDLGASLHQAMAKQSRWRRVLHRWSARVCLSLAGPSFFGSSTPRVWFGLDPALDALVLSGHCRSKGGRIDWPLATTPAEAGVVVFKQNQSRGLSCPLV